MVILANVFGIGIVVTFTLLFIYSIVYFLLYISGKFKKDIKFNDKCLKNLYIMIMLPFMFSGLYVLNMLFIVPYNLINMIVVGMFGLFLIIYPLKKVITKIKDIDYFGGVWWLSYILSMQLWILGKV